MSDHFCFLITILYKKELLRCAFGVKSDLIPLDCQEYPMKPKNRKILHEMLPLHVRSCGPIVEIVQIFDIAILEVSTS